MAVYFVRDCATDLVKIGYATDVMKRLKSIKTYCPGTVQLLGFESDGTKVDEAIAHKEFAASRFRGEWFRMTVPLFIRIAQCNQDFKTWASMDRRFLRLAAVCGEYQFDKDFCFNQFWYAHDGPKDTLTKLVGWCRKSDPDIRIPELYTPAAYDSMYDLFATLIPNCQGCGCPSMQELLDA